jgi:hypothetical protein
VLISYLPPESATATAIRNAVAESGVAEPDGPESDPSKGQWDLTQLLLAGVIDELRWYRHEFRQVNSDKPGPAPAQVPRPGVKTKAKPRMTMEQRMQLDPRMRGEWHE